MNYGFRYVKGTEVEQEVYDNLADAVSKFMLTWVGLTEEERERIRTTEGTFCCTMYEGDIPVVLLDEYDLRKFKEGRACLIMDDDGGIQTVYYPDKETYQDTILGFIQEKRLIHSFGDVALISAPNLEPIIEPTEDEIKAMGRAALTDGSE